MTISNQSATCMIDMNPESSVDYQSVDNNEQFALSTRVQSMDNINCTQTIVSSQISSETTGQDSSQNLDDTSLSTLYQQSCSSNELLLSTSLLKSQVEPIVTVQDRLLSTCRSQLSCSSNETRPDHIDLSCRQDDVCNTNEKHDQHAIDATDRIRDEFVGLLTKQVNMVDSSSSIEDCRHTQARHRIDRQRRHSSDKTNNELSSKLSRSSVDGQAR
jgi:hypothetical protein